MISPSSRILSSLKSPPHVGFFIAYQFCCPPSFGVDYTLRFTILSPSSGINGVSGIINEVRSI